MPSQLSAEVSIATMEAYRNLNQMTGMVESANKSLKSLGVSVAEQDKKIGELAKAFKEAEDQFKATGDEADRLKMEELRKELDNTTKMADKMEDEFQKLGKGLNEFAITATQAGKKSVETNRANADSVSEVAKAHKKAGEEGKKGASETGDAMNFAKGATNMLTGALSELGIGMSVFALLKTAVQEYEDRIKKAAEATKSFGEGRLDYNRKIKDVIDNLGFDPDKQGQARAGKLVGQLQSQTPGLAPEVAATILAKAQATGFKIADKDTPGMDGKTAGMDIAGEVAKFSSRTNLDPDTAGKLFNMAQLAGVKNKEGMEKMLAQMEGAFQNIAITDPREGMKTAIQASAGRMMQGVSLPQALASVAAASIGETEAARAATNVEQFTRVAVGTDDTRKLKLATLAQKQGLISDADLNKARAEVAPMMKSDNVDEIRRLNERIFADKARIEARTQAVNDFLSDNSEQVRRLTDTVSDIDKDLADPKKKKQKDGLEDHKKNALYDIQKLSRMKAEKLSEQAKDNVEDQLKIKETTRDIEIKQKEDKTKIDSAALRQLYAGLPLAAREKLLYDATKGMSSAQLGVFASQVAEGDIAQQVVKQLSPQARAAYDAAQASASGATLSDFRRKNRSYGLSDIAEADSAKQAAADSQRQATPGGQQFLNNVDTLADADISILKSKGEGRVGLFPGTDANGKSNEFNNASSEEVLKAKRKMIIARNLFARWHATIDPQLRKEYDWKINGYWQIFWQRWKIVFETGPSDTEKVRMADFAVREVGVWIAEIQAIAQNRGLNPGNALPNISSPSLMSLDPYNDPEMMGGGGANAENSMGGARNIRTTNPYPGPGSGSATPELKPGSKGVVGSAGASVQYNINVATIVSQSGEEMDLPARLGLPDFA